MTGGLLQLTSYGAQDLYLTGNPQISFFKTIYKRHTNFAVEIMEQSMIGNINFNNVISCLIPLNGDLITKIYFKIDLSGTSNLKGNWAFSKRIGNTLIAN